MNPEELTLAEQALSLSEDVISDHYHLTMSSWKVYRYDVRTLRELAPEEVVPEVFAQVVRYTRPDPSGWQGIGDFYRICLQDHNILAALRREPDLAVYPLLVYVFTHELVHIVRFYKFVQFFDADETERQAEEVRVHQITHELLKPVKIREMSRVIEFYSIHRELII
jgi:hypothetical protein